jgi:molecular chaperone GrpE (heat shock protein)
MGKYYTIEGEEIEAFSEDEVEEKVESAKKEVEEEFSEKLENSVPKDEIEENYTEKKDYEKLSTRHEQLKGQYKSAKDELERRGEEVENERNERKEAYESMRDEAIEKAAGDDEEYAEALRKHYDRIGGETLSTEELNNALSESHVLALNEMGRDITPFNPGDSVTKGEAPKEKDNAEDKTNVDGLVDYASHVAGINSSSSDRDGDNVEDMISNKDK